MRKWAVTVVSPLVMQLRRPFWSTRAIADVVDQVASPERLTERPVFKIPVADSETLVKCRIAMDCSERAIETTESRHVNDRKATSPLKLARTFVVPTV